MADFDLIPNEYRYWLWQRACLKRLGTGLLLTTVAVLAASVYWHIKANNLAAATKELQRKMAISQLQQEQLEGLVNRKSDLVEQWKLLDGLRGGTTVENILTTIDESLDDGDVWFLDWRFSRAGQKVSKEEAAVETGYFIIVPNKGKSKTEAVPETWKISTHISINGQARDHAAFSGFVQRLVMQEEIVDIKVVRTTLKKQNNVKIVDFDILVVIKNNQEASYASLSR